MTAFIDMCLGKHKLTYNQSTLDVGFPHMQDCSSEYVARIQTVLALADQRTIRNYGRVTVVFYRYCVPS